MSDTKAKQNSDLKKVIKTWSPLGSSWFLMALEGPLLYAAISRFAHPEIALAAFGGVVLPITYVIESPVLSLLSASTALSKTRADYLFLRKFAYSISILFTVLHLLLAISPLYDIIVSEWIGAPDEVSQRARLGLIILSPMSLLVGYRRFNQGILIRFGRAGAVGTGTFIRMISLVSCVGLGYYLDSFPGVIVATTALTTALSVEAIYTGIRVREVVRKHLSEESDEIGLNLRKVLSFYFPLAITVTLYLAAIPLYSAAICRMPELLPSLATWPVAGALSFLIRSLGLGIIEVTITFSNDAAMRVAIRKFSILLGIFCSCTLLIIGATPLADLYYQNFSALDESLLELARVTTLLMIAVPALSTMLCYYEGLLISAHRTQVITVSVIIHLAASITVLAVGIAFLEYPGTYIAAVAVFFGYLLQTYFLRMKALEVLGSDKSSHQS